MNSTTKKLIQENITDSDKKTLEFVKISDTVHSWLIMLNRVIDMCNIVDPADPSYDSPATAVSADAAKLEKLFGFMTSADKWNLDVVMRGIKSDGNNGIDVTASTLTAARTQKTALNPLTSVDNAGVGTVTVDSRSNDVQCVNANGEITISIIPKTDLSYYAEKIVSIKANEDISITYSGTFEFVNDATYPNVGYSAIGTARRTVLLKNSILVYKIIFVHGMAFAEIVHNSQLAENYLAPSKSSKSYDAASNGIEVFNVPYSGCKDITENMSEADRTAGAKTLYIKTDGGVSVNRSNADALSVTTVLETNASGAWEQLSAEFAIVVNGTYMQTNRAVLAESNGGEVMTAYLHTVDPTSPSAFVRIDYALNLYAAKFHVSGISLLRGGIDTYDE